MYEPLTEIGLVLTVLYDYEKPSKHLCINLY